jgi:hypothetical protein
MKLINDAVESGVIQDIAAAQAQYNALVSTIRKVRRSRNKTCRIKMLM